MHNGSVSTISWLQQINPNFFNVNYKGKPIKAKVNIKSRPQRTSERATTMYAILQKKYIKNI